jgi:hypothetical protein
MPFGCHTSAPYPTVCSNKNVAHKVPDSKLTVLHRQYEISKAMRPVVLWGYIIALVPFILIVVFRGWDETFRTGEAYMYLLGLTAAVIGENFIGIYEHGPKKIGNSSETWGALAVLSAVVLGITAWGVVLVVVQPRISHPTTSWIQVVLFFTAITVPADLRFSLRSNIWRTLDKHDEENVNEIETAAQTTGPSSE